MPYIDAALRLATTAGYLPLTTDTLWLRELPAWLNALQTLDGMQQMEERLKAAIPASLREFWAEPALVRLLDSWRWQDYLDEEPRLIFWGHQRYVLVCSHPHSGGLGAVAIGEGEDPPLYWGWEDEGSSMRLGTDAFSDFVYLSVKEGPGHP